MQERKRNRKINSIVNSANIILLIMAPIDAPRYDGCICKWAMEMKPRGMTTLIWMNDELRGPSRLWSPCDKGNEPITHAGPYDRSARNRTKTKASQHRLPLLAQLSTLIEEVIGGAVLSLSTSSHFITNMKTLSLIDLLKVCLAVNRRIWGLFRQNQIW